MFKKVPLHSFGIRSNSLRLLSIALLSFLLVSCGGGGSDSASGTVTPPSPTVGTMSASSSLANNATISNTLRPQVSVDFSEAIDTSSITSSSFSFFNVTQSTSVPTTYQVTNTTRVNVVPTVNLTPNFQYRLSIGEVKALSGNKSPAQTILFTLQADVTPPKIIQANVVAIRNLSGKYEARVTFDEPVQHGSTPVLREVGGANASCMVFQQVTSSEVKFAESSFSSNCLDKTKQYEVDFAGSTDFAGLSVTSPVKNVMQIADTLFPYEWHIKNTGTGGNAGTSGVLAQDMNVLPVWEMGITGSGAYAAVVDDGLYIMHPDLAANIATGLSHDYVNGTTDPTGGDHGTAVGGTIGAANNTIGVVGSAFNVKMMGFNLLQNNTASNKADAMSRQSNIVGVSNNSWGPADGYGAYLDSNSVWQSAVDLAVSTGRGNKGVVFLWASGNGNVPRFGGGVDNANYDGYANYHGVMAIGGVDSGGTKPSYAEPGANVLVAGPTMNFNIGYKGIYTTYPMNTGDIDSNHSTTGSKDYTSEFNGTSAATPAVAGVVALMLEANANLSWRDVRWILASTARKNDSTNGGWQASAVGQGFNHLYGYGTPDAEAAVKMAAASSSYVPLGSYTSCEGTYNYGGVSVNGTVNTQTINTSGMTGTCPTKVEFVDVYLAGTGSVTTLDVQLVSPIGRISQLAEAHSCAYVCNLSTFGSTGWRFGSVRHLGELASGNWQVKVNGTSITLNTVKIVVRGN
jgi:proprotein convertase subtilisin/kexin type 2